MRLFVLTAVLVTNVAMAQALENKTAEKGKSIDELKQDLAIEKSASKRFYLLSDITRKYASEKISGEAAADAKKSAETLLEMSAKFKDDWNYGNSVHHSHLVLGRLNLMNGKIEEAKSRLKLAGKTPGSPQLNSFGPNMTLAKELLEKGEKTAVLGYFEDCLRFWDGKFAKPLIDEWKADIAKGKIPSFQANLVY